MTILNSANEVRQLLAAHGLPAEDIYSTLVGKSQRGNLWWFIVMPTTDSRRENDRLRRAANRVCLGYNADVARDKRTGRFVIRKGLPVLINVPWEPYKDRNGSVVCGCEDYVRIQQASREAGYRAGFQAGFDLCRSAMIRELLKRRNR